MTIISFDCPICDETITAPEERVKQLSHRNEYDPGMIGHSVCDDCYDEWGASDSSAD